MCVTECLLDPDVICVLIPAHIQSACGQTIKKLESFCFVRYTGLPFAPVRERALGRNSIRHPAAIFN